MPVDYRILLVPNARRIYAGHHLRLLLTSDDQAADIPVVFGLHASVGTSSHNTISSQSQLLLPVLAPRGRDQAGARRTFPRSASLNTSGAPTSRHDVHPRPPTDALRRASRASRAGDGGRRATPLDGRGGCSTNNHAQRCSRPAHTRRGEGCERDFGVGDSGFEPVTLSRGDTES